VQVSEEDVKRGVEEEIITFLVTAWSRIHSRSNKPVTVTFHGDVEFYSHVKENQVFIPYYLHPEYKLEGLDRWRIWRFLSFHEAMHLLLTAPNWKKKVEEEIVKQPNYYGGGFYMSMTEEKIASFAFNVAEDYRVNEVGVRYFPGMEKEKEFADAYFGAELLKKSQKLMSMKLKAGLPGDPRQITTPIQYIMAVSYAVWHPSIFDDLVVCKPEEKEEIFRHAEEIKKIPDMSLTKGKKRAYEVAAKIFLDAINYSSQLDLMVQVSMVSKPAEVTQDDFDAFLEKLKQKAKESGAKPKESEEEGEGSKEEKDLKGDVDEEVLEEYKIIEQSQKEPDSSELAGEYGELGGYAAVSGATVFPDMGDIGVFTKDSGTIARLLSLLQKWKIGWEEYLDEEGFEPDIEEVITRSRKRFYDEHRTSPSGGTYIMLDISGSVRKVIKEYVRMTNIICEVFSKLGLKFEVVAFTDGPLRIIKAHNEKWGNKQKQRLSGMINSSGGGTPTGDALSVASRVFKLHGIERVIILTDGMPDNIDYLKEMIKKVESTGVKVYMIGFEVASYIKLYFDEITTRNKYALVRSVSELPNAFFNLVRAEVQ